ncbi:MAG: YkgJ family cysteine cluster protein [Methylobacter sp.]
MTAGDYSKDDAGSELCLACGLCCDGTLFSRVPVNNTDNIPIFQETAVKAISSRGQSSFNQPCPAYVNRGCQIYTDRPKNCRKFRCKLLDEYCERKLTQGEAMAIINKAFSYRKIFMETLLGIDPELLGSSLAELWRQWNGPAKGEDGLAFRQKHGPALMQLAALNWFLQQHFRKKLQTDVP